MARPLLFIVLTATAFTTGCGSGPYRVVETNPRTRPVAFSADGKLLAMLSPGEAEVRDVASRKVIATYPVKTAAASVAFSLDGKAVAIGETVGPIHVYDVPGSVPRVIDIPLTADSALHCLAFSPDGKWLAEASGMNSPRVWDASTGKLVAAFPLEERGNFPTAVAFNPDGTVLAAGYDDSQVRLWDMPGGKERKPLPEQRGNVYGIAFTPDGKTLAVCRPNEGVFLHDSSTGEMYSVIAPGARVTSFAISGDGTLMATDSGDSKVAVRLMPTGKLRAEAEIEGPPIGMVFSPDSKLLAVGRSDWTRLYNVPVLLDRKKVR